MAPFQVTASGSARRFLGTIIAYIRSCPNYFKENG